jgi:hypothetical protein
MPAVPPADAVGYEDGSPMGSIQRTSRSGPCCVGVKFPSAEAMLPPD